jgi:hypothetical protein
VSAATLSRRIDQFLASRGLASPAGAEPGAHDTGGPAPLAPLARAPAAPVAPVAFVCEDDVRVAIREGRTILVNERTIITPAARDAGEAAHAFTWEGWRS